MLKINHHDNEWVGNLSLKEIIFVIQNKVSENKTTTVTDRARHVNSSRVVSHSFSQKVPVGQM